ncbi:hypothetical protein K7X08_007234 [Anisodus acutangulus]|uniref:F-box associated beta-propeller type 3 domain-containing protein n=1 Tax=Anisodus acutangulus TaxID=402998 RepID=A0A9Q1LC94_9SOLA|nr:hypothetical protein K7X08_007234 [Anisodus acutangulus]
MPRMIQILKNFLFTDNALSIYGISSLHCCPLSSVQLVEKVQELDCPSNSRIVVYCFCNDLAVIAVADMISDTFILMLWNPSTRESIVLPDPEFPPLSGYCFGLGYDSTSGDYKNLKIRDDIDGSKEPGEILALKGSNQQGVVECNKSIFSTEN